jgi:two-component system sensor histidine kinase KdpD
VSLISNARRAFRTVPEDERGLKPYILGILTVAVTSGTVALANPWLTVADASILHLLPVLLSAVRFGMWPSIATSIVAAVSSNYFFARPHYGFGFDDLHDILTLVAFVVTATTLSYWVGKSHRQGELLRRQAEDSNRRQLASDLLYRINARIGALAEPTPILSAVATVLGPPDDAALAIYLASKDGLELAAATATGAATGQADQRAAEAAFRSCAPAGAGTTREPDAALRYLPLVADDVTIGTLGIVPDPNWLDGVPESIADEIAGAIARARRIEEREHARVVTEAAKLHSALLSSVSHDFRTPLTTIIGAASSLRDRAAAFTPAGRRDLLTTIQESGERLHRYVVNLLNTSRIEAGALPLNRDWVDIGEPVSTALNHLAPASARSRIVLDLPRELPMIEVDFVLMEQVILNLLDNAVKYSPAGTPIRVSARDEPDRLVLEVTNAVTAPPLDLDRVFERFYRQDARIGAEGTGLGLSICKGFVEVMGGTIAARGSASSVTISVTFPVTATARRFAAELADE